MTGSLATLPTTALLAAAYTHLSRLSDDTALFEHARYATPRREHGYCLDDVARGLVVLCRDPGPYPSTPGTSERDRLTERYLAFTTQAQSSDGRFHNRMTLDRRWSDRPGLGDAGGAGACGVSARLRRVPRCRGCARAPDMPSPPARIGARRRRARWRSCGLGCRRDPGRRSRRSACGGTARRRRENDHA